MSQLAIALFGPMCVAKDGDPVTAFYSAKVRALLAILAVDAGRPQRRDMLAGLLWPGYPEGSARRSLSQALYALRRALGDDDAPTADRRVLVATRQDVALNADLVNVDVSRFADHIARSEAHRHGGGPFCFECAERLLGALALYGELLDGYTLRDSPEFEVWLAVQRERYRRQAVGAARGVATCAERFGELATARDSAERWLELEPLDEAAHRCQMRLLAKSGERAAALALYQHLSERLRAELDVAPEAATSTLAAQVRDGAYSRASVAPPDVTTGPNPYLTAQDHYHPPLFVARQVELAALDAHLERALAGEARVVFVAGEPGSGKTALLREFRQRALAAHPDLVVAVGHCSAHIGQGDPCLAFCELLGQMLGDVQARWAAGAISATQASRLWALWPTIGQALAEMGPDLVGTLVSSGLVLSRARENNREPAAWIARLRQLAEARLGPGARSEVVQAALHTQYTLVLQRLARVHPLLLIIEDLQWADEGTISLLFHLGCQLLGARVLIVGALRPDEESGAQGAAFAAVGTGGGHLALQPVIHEFERRFGAILVDLGNADGHVFVGALLDSEPNRLGAGFRAALLRQSGGNALFTVELLRDLQERGQLTQDAEGRWQAMPTLSWSALPARIEGVLAGRIARLPPELRRVLEMCSIEGEIFSVQAQARALGLTPGNLVRKLSGELDRRHLLISALESDVDGQASGGRYRFRHILTQSYLYNSLDAVERRYLHEALGVAHEQVATPGAADNAVVLARHFEAAGVADKAVAYLLEAAERATLLSAHHEAAALYARGLALVNQLPENEERQQRELALQIGLGTMLQSTKGYGAAGVKDAYERARELSQRAGDLPRLSTGLQLLNNYYGITGQFETALALSDQAIAVARRSGDTDAIALAQVSAGWVRLPMGEFVGCIRDLAPMVALYDADHSIEITSEMDALQCVSALTWTTWALWHLGYPDQAARRSRDAMSRAQQLNRGLGLCHAISVACSMYHIILGDYQTGYDWTVKEIQLAVERGFPFYEAMGRLHQGWALAHLGQPEAGLAMMQEALGTADAIGVRTYKAGYLGAMAEAYELAGRPAEALAAVDEGLAIALRVGERWFLAELYRLRGASLLQRGDAENAETSCLQGLAIAREQQARSMELRVALDLARLWEQQGKRAEALGLLSGIYDWFTEGFDTPDLVAARALLAELDPDRRQAA